MSRFNVRTFTHERIKQLFTFLTFFIFFALKWRVRKGRVENKVARCSSETRQQMEALDFVHVMPWTARDG
jgi:hypothetical protein